MARLTLLATTVSVAALALASSAVAGLSGATATGVALYPDLRTVVPQHT